MKITIKELQKICELLLDRVKNIEGEQIVFDKDDDFYLVVSRSERQNIATDHPELGIGSIAENIENLKELLSGKKEPNLIDLERFGQIFISLSNRLEKDPGIL
jgi:hypothetical protein